MIDLGKQFDDVLNDLRGNGRYQLLIVFCVLIPTVFCCCFFASAFIFIIAIPDHWCQVVPDQTRLLAQSEAARFLPRKDDAPDKCYRYNLDYTSLINRTNLNLTGHSELGKIACQAWQYNRTYYHDTIVTDWDLVCSRDFLPTLAFLVNTAGTVVGTPLGGFLADRIGRKRTYLFFLFLQILFFSVSAGSPRAFYGFWIFIALTFIQCLASNVMYLAPLTLGMELVTLDFRATFTVLLSVGYTIGGMVFSGLAYYIMPRLSWRYFTLIITLPFITYASYFWVMPESPRWLLAHEKFDSLRQHLQTMAKINGTRISDATEKKIEQLCEGVTKAKREEKVTKHYSYLDLFRRPQIRKCTLIMIVLTVACSACYNGLSFYAPSALGSNPFFAYFLACAVELPAALFTKLICDRLGRKITIMICFLFGGTACLATLGVPSGNAAFAGVLTLFLFAKLFVTSAYIMQDLLENELFPTVVRGKAVGLLNFLAAFANGIGPVVVYAGYHNPSISLVIFGGIMVFASVCSVFLPETLKTALPETLEECEALGKKSSWKDSLQLCGISGRKAKEVELGS